MASKTTKQLIKGALANLSKDNLEQFLDELLDREKEPRVNRNQVEGKTLVQVAEVMALTFNAGAPVVAVELLKVIGCHKDAEQLEKGIGEQSSNPGPSDTVRPSAGAEGGYPGADFVDKHRAKLIERVSNVASILDQLLENKIITHGAYDDILATPAKRDQMRKLYSGPLNSAGSRGKEVFYKILEEMEKCLVDDLKENK